MRIRIEEVETVLGDWLYSLKFQVQVVCEQLQLQSNDYTNY